MELILIRHGRPLRIEKSDGSPADPELSPEGIQQAVKLAHWMENKKLDIVYSSPLKRAKMTALPLIDAKHKRLIIEPGVAEIDAQSTTYIPLEEMKEKEPEQWRELVEFGAEAAFNNIQDLETFQKIVIESLKGIIAKNKGKTVAVVCHGGVINLWAAHVIGARNRLFFKPEYTSLNRFMASSSGVHSLTSLNETGHLHHEYR